MSAASSAAAMILLVLSIWPATGPMGTRPPSGVTGPVRCWGAAARMAASSSVGVALVIWAAAVDPADVPTIRSASVTSNPASNRPAMPPINPALPVDPPPPRTNARSPAAGARLVASTCGWSWSDLGRSEAVVEVTCRGEVGVVHGSRISQIAWRGAPGGDYLSRAIVNCREHPLLRSWVSPPADESSIAGTIAHPRRGAQPASCRLPCRRRTRRRPLHPQDRTPATLRNILERTAMVVKMVVKNRRAGRPRPEAVHQPEPWLSMTLTPQPLQACGQPTLRNGVQGCSHDLFDAGRACPTARRLVPPRDARSSIEYSDGRLVVVEVITAARRLDRALEERQRSP